MEHTLRTKLIYPALLLSFLAVMALNGWLRIEHAIVAGLVPAFYVSRWSRRFVDALMPFALVGLVYDMQRLLHFEISVHVAGPYSVERSLFGIHTVQGTVTPNEWFLTHHAPWSDVLCAIPYLTYIFQAVALGIYLFLRDEPRARRFAWAFLWLNVLSFATEALFPVAPPWYVEAHGLGPALRGIPGSPGPAAIRFDELIGIPIFHQMYARSTDVFGAIPSLHVAIPALVLLQARELRKRWLTFACGAFLLLMMVAAVYLQHHYVIDLIAGLGYALVVARLVRLEIWQARPQHERPVRKKVREEIAAS
jgi:inositol phosphorylceramide synthase catalytic subunit